MKKIFLTMLLASGMALVAHSQNFWTLMNNQNQTFSYGMAANGDVYALSNSTFLYKSTTNGTIGSWNQITGFPVTNAYSIFCKGNTVFLLNGDGVDYSGRGIYASTNGGTTWSPRNNGLGADTNMTQMYQLANGVLLVGTKSESFNTKFYYSSNDGMSWTAGQTITGDVHSVVVRSASEAYMSIGSKIFRSSNNGQTWTDLNATFPNHPEKLAINSSGNLLGTSNSSIMESTNGGVTWTTKTTTGLPNLSSTLITYFKLLHGQRVYISLNNNQGLYYSDDWGSNWTSITSNLTSTQIFMSSLALSTTGYLFASPSNLGIHRSVNTVVPSFVGIEEINNLDVSITVFPNPVNNRIYMRSSEDFAGYIEIINQFGQVVYSSQFESVNLFESQGIDIEGFSSGLYFVQIKSDKGEFVQKIVKQ
jgi:hypothetical protein